MNEKKCFIKALLKRLTAAMVALTVLPAVPAALADDTDTTGTTETTTSSLTRKLINGDFEAPVFAQSGNPWIVEDVSYFENLAGDGNFGWKSTTFNDATTKAPRLEIVREVSNTVSLYGAKAQSGIQFAELCPEHQGSLYQDLSTDPGAVFNWSLYHAARHNSANSSATNKTENSMALFIGPKQDSYIKNTMTGKDIFMYMAQMLGYVENQGTQGCSEPYIIYSVANPDLSAIDAAVAADSSSINNYFSTIPTETINQKWTCWIITDECDICKSGASSNNWGHYTGVYDIPEGQTETTFAFTALNGGSSVSGDINEGNLLDNIEFETKYPLRVSATSGGSGDVYYTFDPENGSNNVSVTDGNVTSSHDHFDKYYDGTVLTVKATPEEGYSFAGAYIDKTFHAVGNGYFTRITDSSGNVTAYYHTVTMDQARYVQLIFSKDHTVIFDPNGGTYDGRSTNTEITMGKDEGANQSYASNDKVITPPNSKTQFIGWYVGRFPSYYQNNEPVSALGALIQHDVSIEYKEDTTDTSASGTLATTFKYAAGSDTTTERTYSTDASSGLTFVATWEYDQRAKAMTKGTNDAEYSQSSAGGTVEITQLKGNTITTRSWTTTDKGVTVTSGGGDESGGWGRLADTVTMKAEAKDGYIFMGWYENGTLLSSGTVYTYEVGQPHEIEARFNAVLAYPYLSFVSEAANPDTTDATFSGGSHVKVGGNTVAGYGGIGGSALYGNTISTGFSTVQSFNELAYDRCLWTIYIPAASDSTPLSLKTNDGTKPS
ncbi:MAG: hypothetical protein ACI38A_02435, partial [Candidatus Ornithomonoglobus sp.]